MTKSNSVKTVALGLLGIGLLWGFAGAGEFLVDLMALPIPGAIVGMLLLLLFCTLSGAEPKPTRDVAPLLLSHMNLLFLPASVGVITLASVVSGQFTYILITVLASTFLAFAVCGLAFTFFTKTKDLKK
jgi:holin-like protein